MYVVCVMCGVVRCVGEVHTRIERQGGRDMSVFATGSNNNNSITCTNPSHGSCTCEHTLYYD